MVSTRVPKMLLQRTWGAQHRILEAARACQGQSVVANVSWMHSADSITYDTRESEPCSSGSSGAGSSQRSAETSSSSSQSSFYLPTTQELQFSRRSFSTQAALQVSSEASGSSGLVIESQSTALVASDVGSYYPFKAAVLPEAMQSFYQTFYAPRPSGSERRGGCKGLQAELAHSKRPYIMYRECMHQLVQQMQQQPGSKLMLQGAVGSGKSMAMAGLVEWARSNGWIVLYVPSATTLTSGGYFLKRPDTEQYDTIISAQQLLKGMLDAHQDDLAQLQQQRPAEGSTGGTLLDLVKKGLSADDDAVTSVDCALALVSELVLASEQRRVLLAVDDYNALYWRTGYGTSVPGSAAGRRELKVEELRLASSMRLLARKDLGKAAVVAAVGDSIGVPAHVTEQVLQAAGEKLVVPRYSFTEVAHAVSWYHEVGMAAEVPSESQVRKLMMLTCGNGREVRRMAARTSLLDVNQL